VAEAIDYSAAAIYLHFQSREQIAQELCFAGLKRLYERLQSVLAKDLMTRLAGYARGRISSTHRATRKRIGLSSWRIPSSAKLFSLIAIPAAPAKPPLD
jgi:AcrR family transcriptional regulator